MKSETDVRESPKRFRFFYGCWRFSMLMAPFLSAGYDPENDSILWNL